MRTFIKEILVVVGVFSLGGALALLMFHEDGGKPLAELVLAENNTDEALSGEQRTVGIDSCTSTLSDDAAMGQGSFVDDNPAPLPPPVFNQRLYACVVQVEAVFREQLLDVNPEWLPTKRALNYWLFHHVDQIEYLTTAEAGAYLSDDFDDGRFLDYAGLFQDERPRFAQMKFSDVFVWPNATDVDVLWLKEGTPEIFDRVLQAMHKADIARDFIEQGNESREMRILYESMQTLTRANWALLLDKSPYRHWLVLIRIAEEHFK